MGIVKFSIWLNIPSKYVECLYVIVTVSVVTFSESLTDSSCQGLSLCFLVFL